MNLNWINLLIAIGIPVKMGNNLNTAVCLWLACQATHTPIIIIDSSKTNYSLGIIRDNLFIGWGCFQSDIGHFTLLPYWLLDTKPTHLLKLQSEKDWYYEKQLNSIISYSKTSDKIPKSHYIFDLYNKLNYLTL